MSIEPQLKYRTDYRPPDFTITDIDLHVELGAAITTITAVSQVKQLEKMATSLILMGESLTLCSVQIDGKDWTDYEQIGDQLRLYHVPIHFTLTLINEIRPIDNTALKGLYVSDDVLCTQCEAEGFRCITYYLDRPDVLAHFKTKITADKAKYPFLLANGNRIAQGELANGKHWVQWDDPFPKPCYLFALVAGDFDKRTDVFKTQHGREVALELYVDKGQYDQTAWAMECLKNAMKWDETRFGLEYDLDIYMIVSVDFFNMGAMENKGLNIFNSKFVLARSDTATDQDYLAIEAVIGHEYFHNWTGNRVTCRDWFQLSLKEGLTVFRDQEFSSDLGSRSVNRINNVKIVRGAQFAEDASPMAHPIRPDSVIEMDNFYTVTVYEKGGEVIRMIHTLLGEANFQAGMRRYIQRFDGAYATCDDFVQAMEEASGVDLKQFRRWYSQSGTPVLTLHDQYDAATQTYALTVEQQTPPTQDQAEKHPLHIPLDIELYDEKGTVIPLQYQGKPIANILNIKQENTIFRFDQVGAPPTVSLLRGFSAPVKLNYPYSDVQLQFLMQHARDDFARYDAAQMLLVKYIRQFVKEKQCAEKWVLPEEMFAAFRAILTDHTLDPALIALLLTLPSESEIAEQFTQIDPHTIHRVRRIMAAQFAQAFANDFLAHYQRINLPEYRIEHRDIALRALKNCSLHYLALGGDTRANQWVSDQYYHADNMTDKLAALSAAVQAALPCKDALMQHFDETWHENGLVMDKWFALQATSPAQNVLENVKSLLTHRSFSLMNPNRVRALIGAFAMHNAHAFHADDGSGYRFLEEMLVQLNSHNPQMASRLIEPLIRLTRFDADHQALMRQSLVRLSQMANLSNDLFEKITKALEA